MGQHEERRRIQVTVVAMAVIAVTIFVLGDYLILEPALPSGPRHLVMLTAGIIAVVAYSMVVLPRIERLRADEEAHRRASELLARELAAKSVTLHALNATGITLSADLSSETVLQKIVDLARDMAGARFAALGVFDDEGSVTRFITSGLTAEQRDRIGALPRGRGILGHLNRERTPVRLRELKDHPASVPLPPHHPPMHSFLGVPILFRQRSIGNLYLTEKIGAAEFSVDDQEALLTLAAQAAIAIENARLYEQVGSMAVFEERHRIGMELHDGVMQTLYGVGLLVEGAALDAQTEPARAREDLGRAVDRLNAAIADMRSYVLGLRPIRGSDRPLAQSLPEVAHQIATNALLRLTVDVAPAADEELSKLQREAMFFIAANAMGNVARHARASALAVTLRAAADGVVLEIADDGVGFATERSVDGFGLRNMRQRAFEVGGRIDVESAPGEGTRVRFAIRSGGRNGHDG